MTSTNGHIIKRPFGTKRQSNFAMQLIKLVVCISLLVTQICSAGLIIETSKQDESPLIETLIDILESCYTDRFSTVGLAGPSAGSIMSKMSIRATPIPVAIAMALTGERTEYEYRHKLQVFVITTSDETRLWDTLAPGSDSIWWNHMASFFFIDLTDSEGGCSNAYKVLWAAWNFNLLNSKFVCFNQTRGQLIYTFNPYTNKAPSPWHQEGTYDGKNGHPWTLFAREYREDESYCEGLDYDKTLDLGGYEIRGVGYDLDLWFDDSGSSNVGFRQRNVTIRFLMSSLNATWKVISRPVYMEYVNIYRNETLSEAWEVVNQIHDIWIIPCLQSSFYRFENTDVLFEIEVMFMTQYPRQKTQLEKLLSVLDITSRFGVLVVLMVTLLFLKFGLNQLLIPSILDIVLLICNAGIQRVPRGTAPRIYLTGLFIFVVTIQGIYSGVFASLLTKDVRLRTVDTVKDLAESNYKIYGQSEYNIFFYDKAFEGRYFEMGEFKCVENLLRDPKIACVNMDLAIFHYARENNFHVSQESLGRSNTVYLIRTDWPLKERVNEIYRRGKSGGLLETFYRRDREKVIRTLKSYEIQDQEPEVKVLTLQQLGFAFVLLGIGLGCATVTFIIELVIASEAIANLRNRFRR